jgi:nitric oxide reductase NorD protein
VAEPEDVLAEGALAATRLVRGLWARRAGGAGSPAPRLREIRRRLELFIAALFPDAPQIATADPAAPLTLLARLAGRRLPQGGGQPALSSTDGFSIRLPGELGAIAPEEAAARYRLLALEQAARAARGTPALVPPDSPLLRDLFLLAEAVAVDRMLARLVPGVVPLLRRARREALAQRGDLLHVTACERAVEELTRAVLAADPLVPPAAVPAAETPAAALAWARRERARVMALSGRYRDVAPVPLWGTWAATPEAVATAASPAEGDTSPPSGRTHTLPRRPRVREPGPDEDDTSPGTWMVRADDPQEKVEDPAGLQRPADRDEQADPAELADALSELPEARLVRAPGSPREVLASEDPIRRTPGAEARHRAGGIAYPEWDWRAGGYRPAGAIVRECAALEGDPDWAEQALGRHATLVRGVRRDFERLRPRHIALPRQPDGAELDIDAHVAAYADLRGGGVADDRFYIDTRPLRRDVAIALLVDTSASTDSWVSGHQRIIDVEKEALLVVTEALTALGDPYAVLGFSGEGPGRVELRTLKSFQEETGGREVRRRIAGLEPDGYTRCGAAIRHATAGLMRQAARHRLLLVLSDGRPNDVDLYEGRYGIEDTRVAVAEARLQGVHCFCLTVDREAPRYATRIFGRAQFAMLSRAERLPTVLTVLLRDLVRG